MTSPFIPPTPEESQSRGLPEEVQGERKAVEKEGYYQGALYSAQCPEEEPHPVPRARSHPCKRAQQSHIMTPTPPNKEISSLIAAVQMI